MVSVPGADRRINVVCQITVKSLQEGRLYLYHLFMNSQPQGWNGFKLPSQRLRWDIPVDTDIPLGWTVPRGWLPQDTQVHILS